MPVKACLSLALDGIGRQGASGFGGAWQRMAWSGKAGTVGYWQERRVTARSVEDRLGEAWQARRDLDRLGILRSVTMWRGEAGEARLDAARQAWLCGRGQAG